MSELSRRKLVTAAAGLPTLAVPALAPSPASASACTLQPDLIERFVRVRAWFLDYRKREEEADKESDRRFHAATGLTIEQWREIDHGDDLRRKELWAILSKIHADFPMFADDDPEGDKLWDERWGLAEALIECEPRTVVDLAYQAEAWVLADMDMFCSTAEATSDRLIRTFFCHLRTLGGMPPLNDPTGLLSIKIDDDGDDDVEV